MEACNEESQGKLVEEINLQVDYNQLLMQLNVVEIENKSSYAKLHDLNIVTGSLKQENFVLVDKVKCFEDDLVIVTVLPNPSNVKLDQILSFQKPYGDMCQIGFVKNASTSKTTLVNKGKKKIKNLSLIVLRMFFLMLLIRARMLRWEIGPRLRV